MVHSPGKHHELLNCPPGRYLEALWPVVVQEIHTIYMRSFPYHDNSMSSLLELASSLDQSFSNSKSQVGTSI